ncbi:YfhD family protein [Anoxybacillus ayderensis]|nr:YfhD family protein [Anoxybacillus ayderensis G10]MBW9219096.1 YfhD family protein [Anoxybacillus sp. ST70]THD15443.1 YfhD family protein [Anoxybacillus ayderensis]
MEVPKPIKPDGHDVKFSAELADHEDLEAQARAEAANIRQSQKEKNHR